MQFCTIHIIYNISYIYIQDNFVLDRSCTSEPFKKETKKEKERENWGEVIVKFRASLVRTGSMTLDSRLILLLHFFTCYNNIYIYIYRHTYIPS